MSNPSSSQRDVTEGRERKAFCERFEGGQLVEGIVVRHVRFGMFIDLGDPRFLALAELPNMERLPGQGLEVVRPAVGSQIMAVYLGAVHQQPRLRVRSTALRAAAELQHVADLPIGTRHARLLQALSSQEPDVPSAAVWAVRYLPLNEREAFLQEALTHQDAGVAALAIRQVVWLPEGERAAFLQQVVQQQQEKNLAVQAVWMAEHLPMPDRRLFLQEALRHPLQEVRGRARIELERLPAEEPLEE